MKQLIFLISLLITTFSNAQNKNDFENCFVNLDTIHVGETVGCSGEVFKFVNKKYVIHIVINITIKFKNCQTITVNTSNSKSFGLLIFKKNKASMVNTCTDITQVNEPSPIRELNAESGEIVVGFSNPIELYGNQTYHTTILIKKLVFIVNTTKEKIIIENELLWKVLDEGTPG
jgi:hypothetical protein